MTSDSVPSMTKPRVLLAENAGSFVGGGQVSFLSLVAGLDRSRFEPYVVCPEEGDFLEEALEQGIPTLIRRMPTLRGLGGLRLPSALRSWLTLIKKFRIDLLHANGTRAMIYAGLAGRLTSIPVLWHVRVLASDGPLDKFLASLSTKILVNSRAAARRFEFLGSSRGPTVIPNGVDVAQFEQASSDPDLRRRWGLDGKFVLLMLSQLIPSKRQDLAIEALASLRGRGMNASLILVGDEVRASRGERARLEDLARRLGVAKDCIFAGFRRDVPDLLKQADVLIHPGREESFGRALIEAMASGLPVIVAGGGGVEEVVEDRVTSVIIRSASPEVWVEAIEKLHRDPSLRRKMGAAGRRRVAKHFTIESHVAGVEQIYDEVLSSSR